VSDRDFAIVLLTHTQEVVMSSAEARSSDAAGAAGAGIVDMKLEVVVIPVSDVDRAKDFYVKLGWRLDADVARGDEFRIVQLTPPGSGCSIQFGTGVTGAAPGSARSNYLVVDDIEAARAALQARGADVSEAFHEGVGGGRFEPVGGSGRAGGPAPGHGTYGSFATFSDPDGNVWLLQEITARLPGRINAAETSFASAPDLAGAMRRASVAHGEHEQRNGGEFDVNWPDWYAEYMVREQAGEELPT
jgi:predicted enzyme related to lactoylglutathione lyase